MKILLIILFLLINSHNLFANPQICSWIMDEPFKEYQEEAKDQHAAFYVVVSDGECEYGMTIGENSEEKANKVAFKDCEKWRKENNISGKCVPFAVNDKIIWENVAFVTNDEGEREYDNSANLVEYEYRIPDWYGQEKIIFPKYKGVPDDLHSLFMETLEYSYLELGEKPIAETHVIIWNEKKSNLKKVAQNWCEVNRGENFNEECLKVGGGDNKKWFKECVASAYFSPETLKGSIEGNKCWWRGYKNEAWSVAKIVAHEYFHVHQNMKKIFFEDEKRFGVPQYKFNDNMPMWIEEGGAEYFGYYIIGKNNLADYKKIMKQTLKSFRKCAKKGIKLKDVEREEDAIKLRSKCDQGFEYDGGMWATAYLASLSGSNQKVFFDFYEDIAELELEKREEGEIHQGWRESFRKNFNMSYDDFLIEFETFIGLKSKEQLKILDQIN